MALGFRAAKTLLSAVELDLFTTLGDHAMTGEELRVALQLHPRATPDFFDALVALRLLERDGEGPHARYHNTAETRLFLDRTSSGFIGAGFENTNARLYRFWGDLTEALKTGRPQSEIKHTGVSMFDTLYQDPQRLEQFLEAMAAIAAARCTALAEKFE